MQVPHAERLTAAVVQVMAACAQATIGALNVGLWLAEFGGARSRNFHIAML